MTGAGMSSSEILNRTTSSGIDDGMTKRVKPPFRLVKDDTKPVLQDPILRSDPVETEEAVLMLPPLKPDTSKTTK